jgi:hypothetical protein
MDGIALKVRATSAYAALGGEERNTASYGSPMQSGGTLIARQLRARTHIVFDNQKALMPVISGGIRRQSQFDTTSSQKMLHRCVSPVA